MNIFKTYTYRWWQIGIFKLALLSIGVAIGVYWYDFFASYLGAVLVVGIVAALYILAVSFRQW